MKFHLKDYKKYKDHEIEMNLLLIYILLEEVS